MTKLKSGCTTGCHTYPQELKRMRQAVSHVKAAYGYSALIAKKCAMTQ